MNQYRLFEKIPLSLFSPLAAEYAAFYSEVLLVLFDETKRHQEPLSRDLSITLITGIIITQNEIDLPGDIDEQQLDVSDDNLRSKAGGVLRYLIRCAWLHEEIQNDFSVAYTLPDYAFLILSVLSDIVSETKAPLQELIYTIHDLLQAAVRDGDENIRIPRAHSETMRLLNGLKELQHNIGVHIETVLKQNSPREILDQTFNVYFHEVTSRTYHELRTTDHVSRFRPGIYAAISELIERLTKVTEGTSTPQKEKGRKSRSVQHLQEQLQDIREHFDSLDSLLYTIDSRHSQFFESAIRSINHKLMARSTTSGHLYSILAALLDPQNLMQIGDDTTQPSIVESLILLQDFNLLESKSLYTPRRVHEPFTPDLQEQVFLSSEEIAEAQDKTLAQFSRVISREQVRRFANKLLGESNERLAEDIPLLGPEHLPLLMYLRVYGDGSLGYIIEEPENSKKIERNDIVFRNFRICRVENKAS